jgi:hypothetical protein
VSRKAEAEEAEEAQAGAQEVVEAVCKVQSSKQIN